MMKNRKSYIFMSSALLSALVFIFAQFTPMTALASGSTVVACANKKTGALRIAYKKCTSKENSVSWGKTGSQGPAGATGPAGAQGPAGTQGQVGAQGVQGLQGPLGIEQVVTKTIKYSKGGPGGQSFSQAFDSCYDASPIDYAGDSYGYQYCFLEVTGNAKVFVLNVNALGATGGGSSEASNTGPGIVVAPVTCASIKIDRNQSSTPTEQDLAQATVGGQPPFSYPNNVLYDHEYATVRTTGLPLYPNAGDRCLIWKASRMGVTQWTLAIVN